MGDARYHGRYLAAGEDVLQGFLNRHPAARIFYVLVSSYLMAGLVEEVCKYFGEERASRPGFFALTFVFTEITSLQSTAGFVMVDHPDFCSEREMEKAKATMPLQILRDREEDEGDEEESKDEKDGAPPSPVDQVDQVQLEIDAAIASFNPAMQRRSLGSIRSGVTVAMVAVALGFACCKSEGCVRHNCLVL